MSWWYFVYVFRGSCPGGGGLCDEFLIDEPRVAVYGVLIDIFRLTRIYKCYCEVVCTSYCAHVLHVLSQRKACIHTWVATSIR